jgi:MFS family permease
MDAFGTENQVEVDDMVVRLRRPALAALLAWLVPGAGHWYQGRSGKAAVFSLCIISMYFIGMVIGGGKVVYASWRVEDYRWHLLCQSGVGIMAIPAFLQHDSQGEGILGSFLAPPRNTAELSNWHKETASGFDLGTLYTMIAGLLNYLVVFDAYSGPLPMPGQKSKRPSPQTTSE